MSRRFLRSFFAFDPFLHDPFFNPNFSPIRVRHIRPIRYQQPQEIDPSHQIFDRFFTENGVKDSQKKFFEEHFPHKVEKKFDAHQILGVKKDATNEQIKEAYRTKALKYHPKNDSSPQAANKFKQLAQAYDMLTSQKYYSHDESVPTNNFFETFNERIDELIGKDKEVNAKDAKGDLKDGLENAQLYSESTYIENINGKKKVNIEKEFKKNGKIIKLKRVQNFKEDGSKQVTQTLDDGKQVKKKTFVQNTEQKKISQ